MAFRAATCPSCREEIQVPTDRDQVKCMFCGADVSVKAALAGAAGPNVTNLMKLAKAASESGNPAEAYKYFTQVLETDGSNTEAWLGKASAAGWQSTLGNMRLNEMLIASTHAIGSAPSEEQATIAARAANEVGAVTLAVWSMAAKQMNEFSGSDDFTFNSQLKEELTARAQLCFAALENAISIAERAEVREHGLYLAYFNLAKGFFSFGTGADLQQSVSAKMEEYLPRARQLHPDIAAPARKSSMCFIATAAYGSTNHPDLDLLRSFRDEYLMLRSWGRVLIAAYYLIGPPLAVTITRLSLRRSCRIIVIEPLVRAIRARYR